MLNLKDFSFSPTEIINSNNFLNNADIFYAAVVQNKDFDKYDLDNFTILGKENGSTLLKSKSFTIKENDIIFCNTMLLEPLFKHLDKVTEFKNIKLITHQTDLSINKYEFLKKPDCISKWYSTNVVHSNKNLIPIPIGLGNDSNQKTLTYKNYIGNYEPKKRTNKIYANFNLNTNYFHRYEAYRSVFNKDWSIINKPNISLDEYISNLYEYKYCLTPWGNGYDSYRLWEALYAGAIPVTKKHPALNQFNDFPIMYVDSYDDFDPNNEESINFKYLYTEKLNINWWINLIKKDRVENNEHHIEIIESKEQIEKNINMYYKKYKSLTKIKNRNTKKRKLHKNLFGRKINRAIGI